jgi:prepilin-type N-terminal cleavage/methylation domain-containing protein
LVATRLLKRKRGFTFIEVLAAMLFMAIVIPVAVRALTLSNRGGVVAERKRVAMRLADTVLTESVITESWRDGEVEGDFEGEWPGYSWIIEEDEWDEDTMRVITAQVSFDVQGREYSVRLSTLVEEESDSIQG